MCSLYSSHIIKHVFQAASVSGKGSLLDTSAFCIIVPLPCCLVSVSMGSLLNTIQMCVPRNFAFFSTFLPLEFSSIRGWDVKRKKIIILLWNVACCSLIQTEAGSQ